MKNFLALLLLFTSTILNAQENGGPYTPDANTVLLMHFDGNITNSASNGFTLSESMVGTYVDNPIPELGKAYRINNTPDSEDSHCLYSPHNDLLNFEGSFTIEAWVKPGDLGNDKTEYPILIDKYQSFGLAMDGNGNGFKGYVKFENDTDVDFYQNQSLEEGKWYHVVMVSDTTTQTVSFYVHDEQKRPVFIDTRNFPQGSNGKIQHSDADLFIGGVNGGSNIQFDGWIDELRISNHAADYSEMYTPNNPIIKVGETEHFEFYTNISEEEEFYLQIKDEIEKEYIKLSSLWDRPRKDSIFPTDSKITIKYIYREDIWLIKENTPSWKCGFHNLSNNEIYLSPIKTELQNDYYNNLVGLVVNEFAQYAASKRRIIRDNSTYFPPYFLEGFGLFEAGFKPRLDSIKAYMDGRKNPEISFIQDTSQIASTLKKDVTVSLIEGQFVRAGHDEVNPAGLAEVDWSRYIRGYFLIEEDRRFRCIASTEHFFAYSAPTDSVYARQCIDSLEMLLAEYSELYELEINHPWAFTFFHDRENAMEIGGYSSNSNGAGYGGSALSVYLFTEANENVLDNWWNYGVLKHEFFHTVSNHFNMFSFFYNEGLTTYMSNAPTRKDELNLYNQRIIDVFDYYENTFGRPPTMDEFVWDPHRGVDGFRGIDPYFFGAAFFHYIFQTYNYIDVKNFIVGEGDFEGALHKSEQEIESGYLAYLDSLLHPVFEPETLNIPFFDDFNGYTNKFLNWNRANVLGEEGWHIFDQGRDGTLCARIYVNDSPYEEDDWLLSGLFNTTAAENIKISFTYYYWGEEFTPEFYYTTSFQGKIEDTEWIKIEDLPAMQEWTLNKVELNLENIGDELVFAFRYRTAIGTSNKVMIDNFKIEEITTGTKITLLPENNLSIYPNPANSESVISFQTKTSEKVNLSVFDIQGRKICTMLNGKVNAGEYNFPIGNTIPDAGIYISKLTTNKSVSTIKIIKKD